MQIRKLPLEHWFGFTMLRSRALWVNDSNDTSHLYVQHQQSDLYAVKAWWMDKRTNQWMDICIPWTAFTAKNALFYRLYFWISYKACDQKQNGQSKEKSVLHGGWKLSGSLFLPVLAKVSIEVILNFVLKNKPDCKLWSYSYYVSCADELFISVYNKVSFVASKCISPEFLQLKPWMGLIKNLVKP